MWVSKQPCWHPQVFGKISLWKTNPFSLSNSLPERPVKSGHLRGACVAQLFKCPTLGFGSGHDLTVHVIEPWVWLCVDIEEPAQDSLSVSLPLIHAHILFLSLSQNKQINFFVYLLKKEVTIDHLGEQQV